MKIVAIIFVFSLIFVSNSRSALLDIENKTIEIYQSVSPSVVNVSNIKLADNFFYGRVEVPQGAGSGFVWDTNGHIVTNFHVVQGGDQFLITFKNDSKQYKAKVVGVEPKKDIAVLKLSEMPTKLVPIKVGSSKLLQVGQMSLAIGNPFGLDQSLTTGVISAIGRKIMGIGGVKIHDMIQTDAAINQGNSGGPLLNSSAELIGMNTMIFSTSGSSAGLGFAVPVDTIKQIVPQIIQHGKIIRPGLGIGILDDEIRSRYIGEKGVAISHLDEDGPAAKAGLKGMSRDRFGRIHFGDVILKIDNKEVNSLDDIYHALEEYKIGDVVEITYEREKKKNKLKLKLHSI
jgi:S1-C subfamily serine protease